MNTSKRQRQSMIGGAAVPAPDPMEIDADDMNISDDEEGGTRVGDIYIPPPVKPYCSSESVGPRLIITQISNNNFKSYAGEIWLGPFCNCFHAIIGPNGSGKSNVIDSMLFVFGYRANKIRCKKLSVLIHSSTKYTNNTSCRVAVYFAQIIDQPNGAYEIIPNSDFFISRTAFKDNSSFYTINDKRVHFKEVAKLLKQHNIDLIHNRFLILQGEVESISTMKPKAHAPGECGHLEYLEDIIGTERYKEPLLKINNRVDQLTEERTQKHNRCKMAEREMNDLKEPMEEAVEYLKLENALTRTKNLQIQKYISEQNIKLKEFEVEHEELTNTLKEHDEKYEELKKQRLEKEAVIKEEMANYDKLLKKQEDYQNMLKNASSKYDEIQASMDATNKRRKQIKTQLKKEEENLETYKKVPQKNSLEIADCQQKITKLTQQKTTLEEKLQENLEALESQTQPLIEKKEKFETELKELQAHVNECKAALELSESELKICVESETMEKRKYETIKNSYADSRTSFDDKQSKLKELQTVIPDIKQTLLENQQQLKVNKQKEIELTQKLHVQRAEIEEKISSMQISNSNNKVLNALMKQKMDGNIPGILGRLGDLGGIDSKYDVAISTCCGRLDNIVVDNVNTAQACIEYLKQSDAGRATFIALDKIGHLSHQAAQKISTPENAPRLYDLIHVEDPRVSVAFYFALRDTLVADDLDQGTRISYGAKRYRVVALQGEVIEISGTMSGGGRSQLRGRMGRTVTTKTTNRNSISPKEMEALQVQTQEMQSEINYLQQQQSQLERDINGLNHSLKQKENELKMITIDCKSLSEQFPHIEEQLQRQKAKMESTLSDPEKVRELQAIIAEKKQSFTKSQASTKKITDKVNAIQKQINDITGEQIKSVEKKINDLDKQITKLTKYVSQLNVEVTTSVRNVKKCEEKIANMNNEIKSAEEAMLKGNDERAQAEKDAEMLKERISTTKEEIAKAQSGSSDIQKEVVALQKEESAGKMKRLEIEQKWQVLDKKISELKLHIPHWRNNLAPLKLHEIPNETEQEPLKTYTEEELSTYKLQDLQYKISIQEENLKSKSPNLNVIAEYFQKREVYLDRVQVLEEITNKRNEMRQLYDEVRKKRYTEFMQGFNIITKKLKEMYQMITLGGDAELELVDSMDPFSEGVSFSVRPPKKSWKNISNLSGGEKTLSSLALVFALHYYKPSPLYFMDEIDAALDFRNVSIVANYIKARTKNAQFIIISLRSNMFELADFLTGIYKVKDCTNSATIKNEVPQSIMIQTNRNQQQSLQLFDTLRNSQDYSQINNTENYTQENTQRTVDTTVATQLTVTESTVNNNIQNDTDNNHVNNMDITENHVDHSRDEIHENNVDSHNTPVISITDPVEQNHLVTVDKSPTLNMNSIETNGLPDLLMQE